MVFYFWLADVVELIQFFVFIPSLIFGAATVANAMLQASEEGSFPINFKHLLLAILGMLFSVLIPSKEIIYLSVAEELYKSSSSNLKDYLDEKLKELK